MNGVSTCFLFDQYTALHNYTLTDKRQDNFLVRILTCFYLLKTTLHLVFFSPFLIFSAVTSIDDTLTILLVLLSPSVSFLMKMNQNSWILQTLLTQITIRAVLFSSTSSKLKFKFKSTLSWWRSLCRANQWTGFCMIGIFVTQESNQTLKLTQGEYGHKSIFTMKSFFLLMFLENGNNRNHMLAIINEKGKS